MFALLPLLSYSALVAIFIRNGIDGRRSVLFASIPCAVFIAIDTEALSAFGFLTRAGVVLSWSMFAAAALLLAMRPGWKKGFDFIPGELLRHSRSHALYRIPLYGIILLAGLIGLTAYVSAPNTWDAMEYHLPRVFEWINNASVRLYPTIDRQQLGMPPWTEYAMLHAYLLYGGDKLVDLVQWFSYVGFVVTASLLAKELGGGPYTQLVAALLCATIPSAILDASGPKNECAFTYWICLSAYFLLAWSNDQSWIKTIALGCTVALSIFTKGTAYFFLPGIAAITFIVGTELARRRMLLRLPVIAAICLLLVTPFWFRNYTFSGSIFGLPYFEGVGPVHGRMFANSHITPATIAANIVRNTALHLGTPSAAINDWTTRSLSGLIRGLDVDPNSPDQIMASQLGYIPQFGVTFGWRDEVFAGDPVHLLLIGFACLLCLFKFPKLERRVSWFGFGIVAGFILFSALLRWGPWNARYLLPLFALGAPFSAVVLVQFLPAWLIRSATYLLLLASLALALVNQTRPLLTKHGFRDGILAVPRDETYFFDRHREMAKPFINAAHFASGLKCRSIGIDANLLRFEYPMFALLSEDGMSRKIVYSSVQNSTARFASKAPPPCMIVCLGCAVVSEKWQEYGVSVQAGYTFGNNIAIMPLDQKQLDTKR